MKRTKGKLLLVAPPVVRAVNGSFEAEADFANSLESYLAHFENVTFACMVNELDNAGILNSIPLGEINNSDRLTYIPLPYAYREDRYFFHYLTVSTLLRSQIARNEYLVFAPVAQYDWATLAALHAIDMKRKYAVESDWDYANVHGFELAAMAPGPRKVRRALLIRSFLKTLEHCMSRSSLAMLQGQDVFEAYKDVAPNPHKVQNGCIRVSAHDHITSTQLSEKLARINERKALKISYAGRMIGMKGPLDWLNSIHGAVQAGVKLHATWFGNGTLMPQLRREVERLNLRDSVNLAGIVGHERIMSDLRKTDIFLFCHKTRESPRCLVEALVAGCPLVGYATAYSRDLVSGCGGAAFAPMSDWHTLTQLVVALDRDRQKLSHLVEAAAASGKLLDKDVAIQHRIELLLKYLGDPCRIAT